MVPKGGLEPPCDKALVSKTSMSTNSITWAKKLKEKTFSFLFVVIFLKIFSPEKC
jgi:hypothetical protein